MTPPKERHFVASRPKRQSRRFLSAALVIAWVMVVLIAFGVVATYSTKPGKIENPPSSQEANVDISPEGYTLVIALHPKCSCTNASVSQVRVLLDREPSIRRVIGLVTRPQGTFADWADAASVRNLSAMRDTKIQDDENFVQSQQLGMLTSGSVVLFDATGTPRYWGGLTAARAMVGPAPGLQAIHAIVNGQTVVSGSSPVYGCSTGGKSSRAREHTAKACSACVEGNSHE